MEKGIKIYKEVELRDPYMIAAWPGMGHVALRAATYLKEKLGAVEFGEIEPSTFFSPSEVSIRNNLVQMPKFPRSKFYYWKSDTSSNDLIIFTGEAQPPLEKEYELATKVLDVAQKYGARRIYTFAAAPVPSHHTRMPGVWGVATSQELIENLKEYDVVLMSDGHITGMNGLLLGVAKERNFEGVCLLGEIPYYTTQIENPKSSRVILEVLAKMLGIKIDMSGLQSNAKRIEEELDRILGYLKPQQQPITTDDFEKMKKDIRTLSGIPDSAKDKIEKLFKETKRDLSKANELKEELDRWSLYKQYEDRFLDLFRKRKEKS
ncbi:PAC2 family protein [bacterium]|nr:PAC2 family protein [bacterium]